MLAPWKKSYDKTRQHIKKQRHYFGSKGPSSQGYGFSSGHIWMWELDYKESWAPKNWCFWTVVFEKTLQSSLDYRKVQPVSTKGNQSEDSLEGLMLKLNLQHFGHLMRRADSLGEKPLCWERLRAKGEGGDRGLEDITNSMDTSLSKSGRWWRTGKSGMQQSMGSQRVGHNLVTEEQSSEQFYCAELLKLPFILEFVVRLYVCIWSLNLDLYVKCWIPEFATVPLESILLFAIDMFIPLLFLVLSLLFISMYKALFIYIFTYRALFCPGF